MMVIRICHLPFTEVGSNPRGSNMTWQSEARWYVTELGFELMLKLKPKIFYSATHFFFLLVEDL